MIGVAVKNLPLLLALSGCFYVNDGRFHDQVEDADGDGGVGVRFDGPDCVDDNPAIADCDVDGDGYLTTAAGGDDCDDDDASMVPGTFWFHDVDGDGHGDPDDFTTGCGPVPTGWSLSDADCDDANAAVSPEAEERCDPLDRNCDGDPFATAADATVAVYVDGDEDGYGKNGTDAYTVCAPGRGESLDAGDCDDADPTVSPGVDEVYYDGVDQDCDAQNEYDADEDHHDDVDHGGDDCDDTRDKVFPGAVEGCDGIDNDCDGLVDVADPGQLADQLLSFHLDADGDGFGGDLARKFCPGAPAKDYVLDESDCNDKSDAIFPGAVEWCNDVDDNCNDVTDEGTAIDAFTAYFDNDGDGWGGQGLTVCEIAPIDYDGDKQIDALTMRGGDCGNNDPDVYPGAVEICGDSVRQDCTTADPDDCDSDGFLANASTNPDCDDDPSGGGTSVHPGSKEICDGYDNDCDGKVDAADPDVLSTSYPDWYLDADHDGHGSPVTVATKTCAPPGNAARVADDCDDLRSSVHPGALERCDGYDNDCNTVVDDEPIDVAILYEDNDGDGFGTRYFEERCPGGAGWSKFNADCDDDVATVSPAARELCTDGIDNDCDDLVDSLDPSASTDDVWYPDDDKDGFGTGIGLAACGDPSTGTQKYVLTTGDCDDADALQKGPALWFADGDGDKYGGTVNVKYSCRPTGITWYTSATDCNDGLPEVRPGAAESCNYRDDDCDGTLDNNPSATDPNIHKNYVDLDGDTYGAGTPTYSCFVGSGASQGGDCDDADATSNLGQTESCKDMADNNCDGTVNEGCTIVVPPPCQSWTWQDPDGDTFGSMDLDPTRDCSGAQYPEDNKTTFGTNTATFPLSTLTDLTNYTNGVDARIIHLTGAGPYTLTTPINVQANNQIAVYADSPGTVIKALSGRVIDAANSNSTLILQNVRLESTSTNPPEMIHTSPGSRVLLVNTQIDGKNNIGGIYAQGGYLGLFGVTFDHLSTPALGSALTVDASTVLTMKETSVRECGAGLGASPYSILIDANANRTIDGLTMTKSKPLAFNNGTANKVITVNNLEVWDSLGAGLECSNQSVNLVVQRALIARAAGKGINAVGSTGTIKVFNATIVKSGGAGLDGTTVDVHDSFIFDSTGPNDIAGAGSVTRSYVQFPGATVATNPIAVPKFVTYDKNLRSTIPTLPAQLANLELWDLHLRTDSPGKARGADPDDVGYYGKNDSYYTDTMNASNGVPDGWEQRWFGGAMSLNDSDTDFVPNIGEYDRGTCPLVGDTDNDLVYDSSDNSPLDPMAQ